MVSVSGPARVLALWVICDLGGTSTHDTLPNGRLRPHIFFLRTHPILITFAHIHPTNFLPPYLRF